MGTKGTSSFYDPLPFHAVRTLSFISSAIVCGILVSFCYQLKADGYKLPWTLLIVVAVSIVTLILNIFTLCLHVCSRISPIFNIVLNIPLLLAWLVGLALLVWNLYGMLAHSCDISVWAVDDGVSVCQIYKALFSFVVVATLCQIALVVLDVRARMSQSRSGAYRKMMNENGSISDNKSDINLEPYRATSTSATDAATATTSSEPTSAISGHVSNMNLGVIGTGTGATSDLYQHRTNNSMYGVDDDANAAFATSLGRTVSGDSPTPTQSTTALNPNASANAAWKRQQGGGQEQEDQYSQRQHPQQYQQRPGGSQYHDNTNDNDYYAAPTYSRSNSNSNPQSQHREPYQASSVYSSTVYAPSSRRNDNYYDDNRSVRTPTVSGSESETRGYGQPHVRGDGYNYSYSHSGSGDHGHGYDNDGYVQGYRYGYGHGHDQSQSRSQRRDDHYDRRY